MPVAKDIFQHFQSLGKPHPKCKERFILQKLSNLNETLGDAWFTHIINQAGDFAYVIKSTIIFGLAERVPLEEYTPSDALLHRGLLLVLAL